MDKLITIYRYDPKSKEYIGEFFAQYDPKHPEEILMPPNATTKKPSYPDLGKYKTIYFDENTNDWAIGIDYRGVWYNVKSKEELIISDINVPVDLEEYTDIKPENDSCEWTGLDWFNQENNIRLFKNLVNELIIEYMHAAQDKVDRYRNQKDLGIPTTNSENEFKCILKYMQYLRDYTKSGNWWENNPKNLVEYMEEHNG